MGAIPVRLEVANALQMAVRRKRIDAAFRDESLADLGQLNIAADPDTDVFAWSTSLQLAQSHQLTVYDAAYLKLALRMALPLATLDQDLLNAGQAPAWVCWVFKVRNSPGGTPEFNVAA